MRRAVPEVAAALGGHREDRDPRERDRAGRPRDGRGRDRGALRGIRGTGHRSDQGKGAWVRKLMFTKSLFCDIIVNREEGWLL